MIAAVYVVLTLISYFLGLSSGVIQIRLSEALCILPVFTPYAVPGLFIGCFISNLITGSVLWDVVFGSIATLIGAIGTRYLRKKPVLAILSPIISNIAIIPVVLIYAYGFEVAYPIVVLTVCAGEIVSCGVLGILLYRALIKSRF